MSLTAQDKKEMREMMLDTVSLALEQIVTPRFEGLEGKVDGLEIRMDRQERKTDELSRELHELRDEQRSASASLHRRIDEVEHNLSGKIEALEADIKELYGMIDNLQKQSPAEKEYAKLSIEKKLLQLESQTVIAAKEAGVKLAFMS